MKKKAIAWICALGLTVGMLSGCGSSGEGAAATDENTSEAVEETAAPEESSTAEEKTAESDSTDAEEKTDSEADAEGTEDGEDSAEEEESEPDPVLAEAYAAHAPEETVLTVNGESVRWDEYFYCLSVFYQQLKMMGITDWDTEASQIDSSAEEGDTVQDYILKNIEDSILRPYWVVGQEAERRGLSITEEEQAELDEQDETVIENYFDGDRQAFLDYLAENWFPYEFYKRMNRAELLMEKLFNDLYGESGEEISDEDALAYAEEGGYLQAKHILYTLLDDDGEHLSDEEAAGIRAHAEEVLAELRGISDRDELLRRFDELVESEGEDPGMSTYPDGYIFPDGYMVTEFREAAEALEDYGISDIVETSYGYHIILRVPLDVDGTEVSSGQSIRLMTAYKQYNEILRSWCDEAVLEYEPDFQDPHLNESLPMAAEEEAAEEESVSTEDSTEDNEAAENADGAAEEESTESGGAAEEPDAADGE